VAAAKRIDRGNAVFFGRGGAQTRPYVGCTKTGEMPRLPCRAGKGQWEKYRGLLSLP